MDERIHISNDFLSAAVLAAGAEMISLRTKSGKEILWSKNEKYWNRTAPHLFPFVGRLYNDRFLHRGEFYPMPQHGFARDNVFRLIEKTAHHVLFSLSSNATLKSVYPFDFEFQVAFQLRETTIDVSYKTINTGNEILYYSAGGHPAFALNDPIQEYELNINKPQILQRNVLQGSFLSGERENIDFSKPLGLNYKLFENDAIVLPDPPFQSVSLCHKTNGPLVSIRSESWTALGIWTKKNAPFICLEPWWGWADSKQENDFAELKNKAGIRMLHPGQHETLRYSIQVHSV